MYSERFQIDTPLQSQFLSSFAKDSDYLHCSLTSMTFAAYHGLAAGGIWPSTNRSCIRDNCQCNVCLLRCIHWHHMGHLRARSQTRTRILGKDPIVSLDQFGQVLLLGGEVMKLKHMPRYTGALRYFHCNRYHSSFR